MGWDLKNTIQPPSPKTNSYGDVYEVMSTNTALSQSGLNDETRTSGFNQSANNDVYGLGYWQNKLINSDNVPSFKGDDFSDAVKGIFQDATSNYRESFLGTSGNTSPIGVNWEDQKGNRGYLSEQFVTETKQDFEDFAQGIGVDTATTDLPDSITQVFRPWRMQWSETSMPTAYDSNVDPDTLTGYADWQTPDYFAALAKDPTTSTDTGAALTYDRAIEDSGTNITDAQEDALQTLENTEEDLNREQADQQRAFIEELRTGKAAQGITGVRTGRDFRRTMPATKNIALSREKARQEYDNALDKSVSNADRDVERADEDLNNAIMAGISGASGLKNKLETRKQTFHMDDIEDEQADAGLIMDVFYANTQSPAPWPGQCPAGEHMNEAGDACVADT